VAQPRGQLDRRAGLPGPEHAAGRHQLRRPGTDYSDYTLLYDKQTSYIAYFESNVTPVAGHPINPSQWIIVAGRVPQVQPGGLPTFQSVTGWPQTFWLSQRVRVDRDYAVFGELSSDFTKNLTATVGGRFFRYDNSLVGEQSAFGVLNVLAGVQWGRLHRRDFLGQRARQASRDLPVLRVHKAVHSTEGVHRFFLPHPIKGYRQRGPDRIQCPLW
jgi:hypothetical protein